MNNRQFSYSVAIRTLGTSGDKYVKLIDSIAKQTIKAEAIFVVLPEGYSKPDYQLGNETFMFSPKGMITQRLFPINNIKSDYILFCDDDIELSEDFIEKLSGPLLSGDYECAAGPLTSFFYPDVLKYRLLSILGSTCVMLFGRKEYYVKLLASGGWSYNHSVDTEHHRIYKTESLAWTCFCIRKDTIVDIHFEDELWLEQFGYAAYDDQAFFTKLLRNGYKTCVVSDAVYKHNDAKSSTAGLKKSEPVYAYWFNSYVNWHRFWYNLGGSPIQKVRYYFCERYRYMMGTLYESYLIVCGRGNKDIRNTVIRARKDAVKFTKSANYKSLPHPIISKGK